MICLLTGAHPPRRAHWAGPWGVWLRIADADAGPSPVVLPPTVAEGSLELLWESAGPAPSAPGTWQPAVDPAGRIWVSVQADSAFWIFDRDGTYLETWGAPGDGDGELDFVTQNGGFGAVAFRPDGGFYVADSGNARVQQFDADRAFVRAWGTFGTEDGQFTAPQGIAVDGSGNVFVIDDARHDVQVFDADGRYLRRVPTVAPFFGIDQAGRTYNVDWEVPTLSRFGVDGTVDLVVDGSQAGPFGYSIAVAGDDRVFLGAYAAGGAPADRVLELDDAGTLAHVWETGAESNRGGSPGRPPVCRGIRLALHPRLRTAERRVTDARWSGEVGRLTPHRRGRTVILGDGHAPGMGMIGIRDRVGSVPDTRLLAMAATGDADAFDVLLRPRLDLSASEYDDGHPAQRVRCERCAPGGQHPRLAGAAAATRP